VETTGTRKRAAVGIATSENRAYILTMAADKRPTGTHNPNQNSLQRWATEGGAEKGVHQKSPRVARAKKKQPAKAAKKNIDAKAASESRRARSRRARDASAR
jgi:hypothetical protein